VDSSLYLYVSCNKTFSCAHHISKHAKLEAHQKNVK